MAGEQMIQSGATSPAIKQMENALGNIGVTTSQQMIEQQRELVKFNYLNFIVDSLIDNLCLKIY